jgi:2-polyprenyl-3-methyl-5-hydroxy-6-metoxy-1,4-benzoquinol methylase
VEGLTGHPGRLLDVGCGPGEFLAEMSRRGWQVAGLDADPKAVERARARLGPAVACHGVEELPPSSGPYDVITLWHVLEHLERPRQALQLLAAQLAPGGRLLIAVPNLESIDARTYGPDWVAWDAPRHLQHFTWATLERLCREQGLRPIARRGLPVDAPYNALMSERLRWERRRMSVGLIVGLPRAAAVAAVSLATVYLGSRAPLRASTALSTWERSQPSAEPPP